MRDILQKKQLSEKTALPQTLAYVLAVGVEVKDDCIVVRSFDSPGFGEVRHNVTDRTGYECFVNHFHFVQSEPTAGVFQALDFSERMASVLRSANTKAAFRFIISNSGPEWTIRFHTLRPQEAWVSEDLEGYASEAVMVVDDAELSGRQDD